MIDEGEMTAGATSGEADPGRHVDIEVEALPLAQKIKSTWPDSAVTPRSMSFVKPSSGMGTLTKSI